MKWILGPVILGVLALSACGGSSSSSASPPSSTSTTQENSAPTTAPTTDPTDSTAAAEAAIRTAAQAYSDAFLTGKADVAYALLSQRCQAREGRAGFASIVEQAATQYGSAIPFTTFKAEVNGGQARVTYTYRSVPAINQDQEPWVLESGAWHEDDC